MRDKWLLLKNFMHGIYDDKNGYIGEFLRHREVAKFFQYENNCKQGVSYG